MCLLMISSLVPLWCESTHHMISTLSNLLGCVSWLRLANIFEFGFSKLFKGDLVQITFEKDKYFVLQSI